jgi:pilus assembly protein Flp/PilA
MRHLSDGLKSAYAWFKVESEDGVAAIEYGLLAALIAVVIITAVTLVGTNLTGVFNSIASVVHS